MSASFALVSLLGSAALLLWGLRMVRTAAERALRGDLDRHLRRATGRRVRAFLFGLVGAAALQSSTAIVLLAAGFAAKARVTLAAGLAVALGADVGAALIAQVLTLDVRELAPAAIFLGYILFQASDGKRLRNLGRALIGLGLVLMALGLIVGMAETIRASQTVPLLLSALTDEPALAILTAALLTWLAHSSLAIVLLIASLTAAGVVGGTPALFLVLGANLGAALPALSGSLAEPAEGRRVPAGNLLFRTVGVIALASFAGWFHAEAAARGLSDAAIVMLGHIAFNLAVALAALPFVGTAAAFLERAMPGEPEVERPRSAPRNLHPEALSDPARAIANARREALRLADLVQEMLDDSERAFAPDATPDLMARIGVVEDEVDALNSAIKFYVTELTRAPLTREQSRQAHSVISFATNMEHIGDIVDRNIRRLADRKHKGGLTFSEQGARDIAEIYERVRGAMQTAVAAFMADDEDLAEQLIAEKRAFRAEELAANQQHLERLREGNPASIDTSSIHLDLLRDLKRVHSHLTSIAYTITERERPGLENSA